MSETNQEVEKELLEKKNKKEIVELVEEFVDKNVDNNEIPSNEIMEFLGNLGDLLVPFSINKSFCNISEFGISEELKNKVSNILINNGYQPIEEERAFIISSLYNRYRGFVGCRVGDMGVHIKEEDLTNGVLDSPELLSKYVIDNFLNHLEKSVVTSVYYDFGVEFAKVSKYSKKI